MTEIRRDWRAVSGSLHASQLAEPKTPSAGRRCAPAGRRVPRCRLSGGLTSIRAWMTSSSSMEMPKPHTALVWSSTTRPLPGRSDHPRLLLRSTHSFTRDTNRRRGSLGLVGVQARILGGPAQGRLGRLRILLTCSAEAAAELNPALRVVASAVLRVEEPDQMTPPVRAECPDPPGRRPTRQRPLRSTRPSRETPSPPGL